MMKLRLALIATTLLASCSFAHADAAAIAHEGSNWVRVTALPCNDPAMVAVLPDEKVRLTYRAALAFVDGKKLLACWRPEPGYVAFQVKYEDGGDGRLLTNMLRPEKPPGRQT